MTRLLRPAALVLGLALLAISAPGRACSPVAGYRVPTNFEMVERADTILLGVVDSGPMPRSGDRSPVIVRPTVLLKGRQLPERVELRGTLAGDFRIGLSDPDELQEAHPNTYAGACTRSMFILGSTMLLFFTSDNGVLRQYSPTFSRAVEDVPGPNSRWVRAVRLYVEIARLPVSERRAALAARRDVLKELTGDADALAIADDIDRHLRTTRRRITSPDAETSPHSRQ